MLELLHQAPLFAWLPEEGAETLPTASTCVWRN